MKVKPSAAEIEAYYLNDRAHSGLDLRRYAAVRAYVHERYLDGGTRGAFIKQRERVEREIASNI